MTEPIKLRIGDRTIWIVRPQDVERWPEELAAGVLREAADEWPVRESLLRLSDELHGPEQGVGATLAFLADAFERGTVVAVRMPDEAAGLSGPGSGAEIWDDVPRLSDLTDPPGARKDGPGGGEPPGRPRPLVPDPWGPGHGGDPDVSDPAASFVAFAVFDQHGKRLRGRSECTVDASSHSHALERGTIEIRPIGPHARIELTLAGLEQRDVAAVQG